jgi:hypothetical protein
MGKQIATVMEREDEVRFLNFLKESSDIVLIEAFADTPESLWKNEFEPELRGHFNYYIYNKDFYWEPEYKQTINKDKFYISNKGDAPLIEISRSKGFEINDTGRIYWAKNFAAPCGLHYDVDKFSRWYDYIVKWVKKNSGGKVKYSSNSITYYLPCAWELYLKCCGNQ